MAQQFHSLVLTQEKGKHMITKKTWTQIFTATVLIIAPNWKELIMFSNRSSDKLQCISTMEYYSAINELLIFTATWRNLKSIMLTQSSKLKKNTTRFHLNEIQIQIKLICSDRNKDSSLGRRRQGNNQKGARENFLMRCISSISGLRQWLHSYKYLLKQTTHFHLCISLNKFQFNLKKS